MNFCFNFPYFKVRRAQYFSVISTGLFITIYEVRCDGNDDDNRLNNNHIRVC
jgi:hypothetical protein